MARVQNLYFGKYLLAGVSPQPPPSIVVPAPTPLPTPHRAPPTVPHLCRPCRFIGSTNNRHGRSGDVGLLLHLNLQARVLATPLISPNSGGLKRKVFLGGGEGRPRDGNCWRAGKSLTMVEVLNEPGQGEGAPTR